MKKLSMLEIPKNASHFCLMVADASLHIESKEKQITVLVLRKDVYSRFWSAVKTAHPDLTFENWDGENWKQAVDVIKCIDDCVSDINNGIIDFHFKPQTDFFKDVKDFDYVLFLEDNLSDEIVKISNENEIEFIENFTPATPHGHVIPYKSPSSKDVEAIEYIKTLGIVEELHSVDISLIAKLIKA